jgi:arsenite oxidase small subunit
MAGAACGSGLIPSVGQPTHADAHTTLGTTLPYPRIKLANVKHLSKGAMVERTYPDASSPISLLKLGRTAINGVGPEQDIVAFSRLCSHMGGTLHFRPDTQAFHCPLHYALFDAAKGGLTVIGQATDNLPQIELEVDSKGDIFAVGVRGLIYGRQANVLA